MTIKNNAIVFAGIFLFIMTGCMHGQIPDESLKQNFPQIKAEKVTATPIDGVYEVITKNGIFYYVPKTENLIAGEIYAKDGRSLTQERRLNLISEKQKDIPMEKGMKMGTGIHQIIEFSNPDCSYCRKASKYLAGRTDITRYVFFIPFAPQTEGKVKYILCAADKAKAYEEAMTGKLDDQQFSVCADKNVEDLLKTHKDTAQRLGIDATPFFFIDGKVVQGADMPAIEKLLGAK